MNNDLLPFPSEFSENNNSSNDSILPEFPVQGSNEQLTSEELVIVRQMISEYKEKTACNKNKGAAEPVGTALFDESPVPVSSLFCDEPQKTVIESASSLLPENFEKKSSPVVGALEILKSQKLGDPFEADFLKKVIEFVKSADETSIESIAVAILGLVPCKKFIRHGTPEQKLFVLKSLGDRLLDGIAGIKWSDRRKFIKAVSSYLSVLSENYNFISMEGENFNPMLHERVMGISSGSVVKEMRGFLVVAKGSSSVVYAGVVLT